MVADASLYGILLMGVLGVLVGILFLLMGISRTFLRIERRIEQGWPSASAAPVLPRGSQDSTSPPTPAMIKRMTKEGDFMAFLAEDPARRSMPKREQFAAYRKWRKERGLSWPHGTELTSAMDE